MKTVCLMFRFPILGFCWNTHFFCYRFFLPIPQNKNQEFNQSLKEEKNEGTINNTANTTKLNDAKQSKNCRFRKYLGIVNATVKNKLIVFVE